MATDAGIVDARQVRESQKKNAISVLGFLRCANRCGFPKVHIMLLVRYADSVQINYWFDHLIKFFFKPVV